VVSKLVVGSVVLIAVGLVLVAIGNPSIRFVTGATSISSFTTFTRTFGGNFTGTFPGNFTSGGFRNFAAGSRVTVAALESLAGIALVGAGLLLEVFSIFIRSKPPSPPA